MEFIYALLLIGAFVCFVLAAKRRRDNNARPALDLVAIGLALWVLVPLLEAVRRLVDFD